MQRLSIASAKSIDVPIDWSKCCFCQTSKGRDDPLVCPAHNPVARLRNRAYASIAPHLRSLEPYPTFTFPSGHRVQSLDEGEGIEATLTNREARWHKSCVMAYQPPKIDNLLRWLQAERDALSAPYSEESVNAVHQPQDTPRVTRSATAPTPAKCNVCFLCSLPGTRINTLNQCETKEIEEKVRKCAEELGDTELLSQILTYGDLIAQEAKYHLSCLVRLYNRARRSKCKTQEEIDGLMCEGMAFAELISFIAMKLAESRNNVFKMADLMRRYHERLAHLMGSDEESLPYTHTHSSRMREKILARLPELRGQKAGRDYLLMHNEASLLLNIEREDQDDNAIGFQRFVKSLRQCISQTRLSFSGEFPEKCEERSVPAPLLGAVTMLLYGSKFALNNCGATRPALTISQLIMMNYREEMPTGEIVRHHRHRETPFPLYVALSTYGRSRSKASIDELHKYGVSVSHNRVMEVTSQLCRMVVGRAEEEKLVCPANLQKHVFTIAAFDNIDFKARSTTSGPEFHGTGMSIFQVPMEGDSPEPRTFQTSYADVERRGVRTVPELPESYTNVDESFVLPDKKGPPPPSPALVTAMIQGMEPSGNPYILWKCEREWLTHTHEQFTEPDYCDNFSWSAYYSSKEESTLIPGTTAMLPLFDVKSTSPAMIKHGLDLTEKITQHLNPGQTSVMVMDQPLYALAKKLQWSSPATYGEHRLVMLLGPFHIEKAFLSVIGQLLDKSGWVHIVASSGITTAGSAEAALKVTDVLRSRVLFQKTAVALHSLILDSYEEHDPDQELSLLEWLDEHQMKCPTLNFWLLIMNLICLELTFVRSLRSRNYELFGWCLSQMLPWFFLVDHPNYARWLSVQLRDLLDLKFKAPQVLLHFQNGQFVFNGTGNPFSCLAFDQAHEQNNAIVKDSGGVIGLTHDAESLRRVLLAGPEIARLLKEFKNMPKSTGTRKHHEEYSAYQRNFKDHCIALKNSFQNFQNPFSELGPDLIALDTREAVSVEGVKTLLSLVQAGRDKYMDFVDSRLTSQECSFYQTLPKSNVRIFGTKKKP